MLLLLLLWELEGVIPIFDVIAVELRHVEIKDTLRRDGVKQYQFYMIFSSETTLLSVYMIIDFHT